ncbi:MAG: hypothetical protein ACP5N2_06200 [Candidatus Nanoarchaeia archaeon]
MVRMRKEKLKEKNHKKNVLFLVLILFLVLSFVAVEAVPPLPTEIYGRARVFNQQAPVGTIVSVFDSNDNLCGTYRLGVSGYFGVLTCRGEDEISSGPIENEVLKFRINNQVASSAVLTGYTQPLSNNTASSNTTKYGIYNVSEITWQSGFFKEVLLVIPTLICGDAFCDSLENCNTCAADCGVCPPHDNDGNETEGGSGGGGGGSGGGDFGGEVQDVAGADTGSTPLPVCEESWICGDWNKCLPYNYQLRDCVDVNACGTSSDMPNVAQDCVYSDILLEDNLTTYNGSYVPPRRETPGLISVCKERLPFLSLPSLVFIFLLIFILIIAEIDYRRKIRRIFTDKALDELKKLELKYLEQRKKYVFLIVIIVIAVIVYLYHYFFLLCKDKYVHHLWLLLIGIILMPILVHALLAISRFSEFEKNRYLQILNDNHYKHVLALINIANDQLVVSEKDIVSRIYILEQKPEFNDLISKNKIVEKIYLDMSKLFNLYKTLNNPMNVEKDLLENIRKLDQDNEFLDAAKLYPELGSIRSALSMIYSAYEAKQGLYDELNKIEQEYGIKEELVR